MTGLPDAALGDEKTHSASGAERRGTTMSTERERAERLAEEEYEYEPPEQKTAFVAGCLASRQLTDAEWVEVIGDVARAMHGWAHGDIQRGSELSDLWVGASITERELWIGQADVALAALGFTRKAQG